MEFGPIGGGHHGPDEWVSISSLERYRRALVDFVNAIPKRLGGRPPAHCLSCDEKQGLWKRYLSASLIVIAAARGHVGRRLPPGRQDRPGASTAIA